jgi:hypothetical protein
MVTQVKMLHEMSGYDSGALTKEVNRLIGRHVVDAERARARSRSAFALAQQPQAPEARVALAVDHQMVVDGDARRLGGR